MCEKADLVLESIVELVKMKLLYFPHFQTQLGQSFCQTEMSTCLLFSFV